MLLEGEDTFYHVKYINGRSFMPLSNVIHNSNPLRRGNACANKYDAQINRIKTTMYTDPEKLPLQLSDISRNPDGFILLLILLMEKRSKTHIEKLDRGRKWSE